MIILVMGVSGSGKTTIGQKLAEILNAKFYDGDDFHPEENIAKMRQNIPLTDRDRQPWLQALQQIIDQGVDQHQNIVLACSALKKNYRDQLFKNYQQMTLVYLTGSFDLIKTRLKQRSDHFMREDLLQSQFDALEPPEGGIHIDISQPVETILEEILRKFNP